MVNLNHESPNYLSKRIYIKLYKMFKVCRKNFKLYNFEVECGFSSLI